MTERNTSQGVRNWLTTAREDPWTFPTTIGQNFSSPILRIFNQDWHTYDADTKLGILLSLLCIKKLHLQTLEQDMSQIIKTGIRDPDEWVRLTSEMVADFPRTGALNIQILDILPGDSRVGLERLIDKIKRNGIKFHPMEYAYIDLDICDTFSTLSLNASSREHSVKSHFQVNTSKIAPQNDRLALLRDQGNSGSSIASGSTMNVAGSFPAVSQNSPIVAQNPQIPANRPPPPRPQLSQSSSSLFIPKRRPSQVSQPSFLRPANNSSRPAPINTARASMYSGQAALGSATITESPTDITTGKTFQKPKRIQMLDMSTGTSIMKIQEETLLKTQQVEAQAKETKRLEKERRQEERRREEEEKRLLKEREKADKQRQREEARFAKEKEKRDKAAAKQAAAAVVGTSTTDNNNDNNNNNNTNNNNDDNIIIPNIPPAQRKKKRMNNDTTIQEEQISEEDLHHKNDVPNIVPPITPVSPTNTFISVNPPTFMTEPSTSEPASAIDLPDANLNAPKPSVPMEPATNVKPNNMPQSITAEQLQALADGVFEYANYLSSEDRQTIMDFLAGTYERKYSAASSTPGVNDVIRDIVMHIDRTPLYGEGREIIETVVFEMNTTKGTWRKLKRKKVKRIMHDGLNGKTNGNEQIADQ
ncbi:hypothetical protein G9A89_006456 [Geosiphon pyriformis]|nr:hypothetical protein G9A89_006456 [Geosiphon pyriformis]